MQTRPKVARLDDKEAEELEEQEEIIEPQELLSDEAYYAIALKCLQQGMNEKDIAKRLVSDGLARTQAKTLIQQVQVENPEIQRSNAYILFGAAILLGIAGFALLIMQFGNIGSFAFTLALLLIALGGWFLYKGFQTYQNAG
jgi:hypothetical protein